MLEHALRVTIRDCKVSTFRSGGPGGQHQNKTNSGVRVYHAPSGAVGESREERSQLANKRRAFERMAKSRKFDAWARATALGLHQKALAQVEEQMDPDNLIIEYGNPS